MTDNNKPPTADRQSIPSSVDPDASPNQASRQTYHDNWYFIVVLEVSQPDTDRTYDFEVATIDSATPDGAVDEALGMAASEGLITHAVISVKQTQRDE